MIDPKKVIRLMLSYPASTGRNFVSGSSGRLSVRDTDMTPTRAQDEILRAIDSLQLGDKHRITTPVNWRPGQDVIVHPGVSNDEAKTLFPEFRSELVNLSSHLPPKITANPLHLAVLEVDTSQCASLVSLGHEVDKINCSRLITKRCNTIFVACRIISRVYRELKNLAPTRCHGVFIPNS